MLQPEPIVRDAEGFWVHSCVLNGPEETAWPDLPGADGMEFYSVGFYDDVPHELQSIYAAGMDGDGNWRDAVTRWQPTPPVGDEWFLVGIFDTEDGPHATFARPAITIREIRPLMILPAAPGKCQTCAVDHLPAEPHNAQSLYYQMKFQMEHGRGPTWLDAMAHCTEEVREIWLGGLKARGVDVEAGEINPTKSGTLPAQTWEVTAAQIQGRSEAELRAKLDEIGPTVETHQLDCQCEVCAGFLSIMDEIRKRQTAKRRNASNN